MGEEVITFTRKNSLSFPNIVLETLIHQYEADFERKKSLNRYIEESRNALPGSLEEEISEMSLINRVLSDSVDIIYFGGFHSLSGFYDASTRLISRLSSEKQVDIYMEDIPKRHQKEVDKYLDEDLSLEELERYLDIDLIFDRQFRWSNTKRILQTAREKNLDLYCLDGDREPTTQKKAKVRDENMAESLVRRVAKSPVKVHFVISGNYHLTSNHLPKNAEDRLKNKGLKKNTLTVFNDSLKIIRKTSYEEYKPCVGSYFKTNNSSYARVNSDPFEVVDTYIDNSPELLPLCEDVLSDFILDSLAEHVTELGNYARDDFSIKREPDRNSKSIYDFDKHTLFLSGEDYSLYQNYENFQNRDDSKETA